jgi:hypothetical protein
MNGPSGFVIDQYRWVPKHSKYKQVICDISIWTDDEAFEGFHREVNDIVELDYSLIGSMLVDGADHIV